MKGSFNLQQLPTKLCHVSKSSLSVAYACECRHDLVVTWLLQNGANPMLFDSIHTRVRHLSSLPHNWVEQPAATQVGMVMRRLPSAAAGMRNLLTCCLTCCLTSMPDSMFDKQTTLNMRVAYVCRGLRSDAPQAC